MIAYYERVGGRVKSLVERYRREKSEAVHNIDVRSEPQTPTSLNGDQNNTHMHR
jgi:hypothetical protein